ncbi:MAG TPA: UDP-glucose/GDP-mannose dehydrogenase family protein [Mariprofundaceae bacterium]|nr:UDP-glucose/GDP-mannose dehydrogenase family protein [Mariprofundaceae bacterium]
MQICVVGSGYVGLVTAACLAEVGHHVTGIDVDAGKVEMLNEGGIPIYEPGLESLVARNRQQGRLRFTTDYTVCEEAEAVFIAVGTPPGEDGSADLQYVMAASESAAAYAPNGCLLVVKSTVPVGTTDRVADAVLPIAEKRGVRIDVAFNPEFLREGNAVDDFLKPDRIIIGVADDDAEALLRRMYGPFNRNRDRMQVMNRRSAELSKYAANCMLATRISFMNELARLCERVDADIEQVRQGIGSDPRIGPHFLYAGIGYGGSCFPKDVSALIATAKANDTRLPVVEAVYEVNATQRQWFIDRVMSAVATITEKPVRAAVWGLAFKPGTDDMREAPSIDMIHALLEAGVDVVAHDPVAMEVANGIWGDRIRYVGDPVAACQGADILIVLTEWLAFREPEWRKLAGSMRGRWVFDARNIYERSELQAHGLSYAGIGRGRAV